MHPEGFEPPTTASKAGMISISLRVHGEIITQKEKNLVRPGRIELPSHPWQGRVLPLNHDRIHNNLAQIFYKNKIQ